jgi:N-acetylmuramoyl-L-alanine amidase
MRLFVVRAIASTVLSVALGLCLIAGAAAEPQGWVTDVRLGQHENHTRFVISMSRKLDFEIFTLADPYRIVIDFPEVGWRLDTAVNQSVTGVVKGFRYGLYRPGRSRMVIDLASPAVIQNRFLLPPGKGTETRLVLDFVPTGRSSYLATAGWPKDDTPGVRPDPGEGAEPPIGGTTTPTPAGPRTVVIDPGHGGVDPGATGVSGTPEKDIVLSLGRELSKALSATGRYKVVMTRDTDIFLSLRARVAVARRAGADIFISLHADAAPGSSSARGASVYTLSEQASDREAAALAHAENQSDIIAGVDLTSEPDIVTNILIDLAQRETKNNSVKFAKFLVPELQKVGSLTQKTHRFAGFAVLKAPDVPSVLIELGYLTNSTDESTMRTNWWKRNMAKAITRSVDQYFSTGRHDQRAAPRSGGGN